MVLAHQYISQLTETGNEKIKNAIFGNVGTTLSFRIGAEDAMRMEKEFEPVFSTQQLINLDKTQIALKLSIHGKATNPFLANTLPPIFEYDGGRFDAVRDISRERYGTPKEVIKDKINRWLSEGTNDPKLSASKKRRKKKNRAYLQPLDDDKKQNESNHINNPKKSSNSRSDGTKQKTNSSTNLQNDTDSAHNNIKHYLDRLKSLRTASVSPQKPATSNSPKDNLAQLRSGIAKTPNEYRRFDEELEKIASRFDLP